MLLHGQRRRVLAAVLVPYERLHNDRRADHPSLRRQIRALDTR